MSATPFISGDHTMDAKTGPAPKRPYARPELRVYGGLREVTLTSISMAMNDPGNSSGTMT